MKPDTKETLTRGVGWVIMAAALYSYTSELWAPLMIIGFALTTAVEWGDSDE